MEGSPGSNKKEASSASDFSFAFNNTLFSDRILKIKILPETVADGDVIVNWAKDQKHKKPRDQQENDDQNEAVTVKTIHVNSAILAAKSAFFYKLFANGMRETEQREVTLHIGSSEEVAFMDLLNFIYHGTLNAQSTTALDVLIVADKFEVPSCMNQCIALLNLSMTLESASLLLCLPSRIHMIDVIQPLINSAKAFLRDHFSKYKRFEEEYMTLPLAVMEEVLSSNELQVLSEDVLYDLVMNWAKKHYPNNEDRKEVLRKRLWHLIRVPQLSIQKVKEVIANEDLDCSLELLYEALLFKAESLHRRKRHILVNNNHNRFCERLYSVRSIRVMDIDTPQKDCMVLWDIKKDSFVKIDPNLTEVGLVFSECVFSGDNSFQILLRDYHNTLQVYLRRSKQEGNMAIECTLSIQEKPSGNFRVQVQHLFNFVDGTKWSQKFSVNVSDNLLIDNVFHLQFQFKLRP